MISLCPCNWFHEFNLNGAHLAICSFEFFEILYGYVFDEWTSIKVDEVIQELDLFFTLNTVFCLHVAKLNIGLILFG